MDSRSQSDSDGGGGHRGQSPGSPHDEGGPQPRPSQTRADSPDPGLINGQPPQAPAVLSLEQIRITGSCNEYTEGPTVTQRSPASQQKDSLVSSRGTRTSRQQETQEEGLNNLRNLQSLIQHGNTSTPISSSETLLHSSTAEETQSIVRTSWGSASSGHIIRTQPKREELIPEELKPLNDASRVVAALENVSKESSKCENCGRCQCSECTSARVLPSCWMCGRRCVCSAHSAVEYGTCVCCIKGLFYHCSSDDEDTCADKPFSCSQSHCCIRWTTVSLLSLLFPCLLCYLPAKGCVAVCQSCYDRVSRPGCRCKNAKPVHCEDGAKQT
ncbi:protein sprouty homolog 2 [Solea solea]|uniref:protein sprouty homolog 2 n=1 Tax=Solea solea TaxID=90069 RepID=UPI00272BB6D4|nr:protein sprouty homolog 2 [Solea solea]